MADFKKINGACFCGENQFEVTQPAVEMHHCHCSICRRLQGAAFVKPFEGKTQPIGLMWGTMDVRSVRFNGKPASPGVNADYIRRNAMNAELIEMGWWSGTADYPKAAFYSFTHPQPAGIENAQIGPLSSRWDPAMREFILDYDDLRKSNDPDGELLSFFQSGYEAGAQLAGWDRNLVGTGRPD